MTENQYSRRASATSPLRACLRACASRNLWASDISCCACRSARSASGRGAISPRGTAALPELQPEHEVVRFNSCPSPPLETGLMWSTTSTTSGGLPPQYWQVNPSRLKISKRVRFEIGLRSCAKRHLQCVAVERAHWSKPPDQPNQPLAGGVLLRGWSILPHRGPAFKGERRGSVARRTRSATSVQTTPAATD